MKVFVRNFYYRYEIFRMHRLRKAVVRAASMAIDYAVMGRLHGLTSAQFEQNLRAARETLVMLDLEINLRRIAIRAGIPKQDAEFFNRAVVYRRLGYAPKQEIKIN